MGERRAHGIATATLSVLMVVCLSPLQALAATSVNVEGTGYTAKANGSGSNGGTWAWDGADAMTLDGYDGGSIFAEGDLDIALSGDNTVTASDYTSSYSYGHGSAIYVGSGDLTITGDGTLDAESGIANSGAIEAYNGGVSIEDTTVTVKATADQGSDGISSFGGDVDITGSDVDVTCNATGQIWGWNIGILSNANYFGNGGQVNITSSDVSVTCTGDASNNSGIMAVSDTSSDPAPSVNIVGSDVSASAPGGAIFATGYNSTCKKGTVTVTGSTVTSPEGASVLDIQSDGHYANGQAIGTGTGTLTYLYLYDTDHSLNPAIATDVTIEKPSAPVNPVEPVEPAAPVNPVEPAAPETPAAAAAPEAVQAANVVKSTTPATGDDALPAALVLCGMLASGGALLLARRQLVRR